MSKKGKFEACLRNILIVTCKKSEKQLILRDLNYRLSETKNNAKVPGPLWLQTTAPRGTMVVSMSSSFFRVFAISFASAFASASDINANL